MEELCLCELCGKRAGMVCESEQAKLCWDCDGNVHGANFLVAKHVRVLLCRLCHRPTPWKASGPSLTPTSSLCHHCVPSPTTTTQSPLPINHHHVHDDGGEYHSYDDDEETDNDDDADDVAEEEEDEEGENQVVPLSSATATASASANNSDDNDGDIMSSNTLSGSASSLPLSLKRFSHNTHHSEDEDEIGCFSSKGLGNDEWSSSMSMFRPLKQPRMISQQRNINASHWHNNQITDGEELKIKIYHDFNK